MNLIKHKLVTLLTMSLLVLASPLGMGVASAQSQCGKGENKVETSIDFGCKGQSCTAPDCSAIIDVTFAVIRFLSAGVGLVIVGSLIFAGIQYSGSRGDPKAVEMAQMRIRSTVVALIIFIFAYAILNYVIPTGFLNL